MSARLPHLRFRIAVASDAQCLTALIAAWVRGLQANDHSPSEIDQALGTWLGSTPNSPTAPVSPSSPSPIRSRRLAAVGRAAPQPYGRITVPAATTPSSIHAPTPAKIRAFFVHPAWVRKGIGSRTLALCEEAGCAEGFTRFEMGATLTGIPLYRRHGYLEQERIELLLANGETLPIVSMNRSL